MALMTWDEAQDWAEVLGLPDGPATGCLLCGKLVGEGPFVAWMGSASGVAFHPLCAMSFARGILEDVEQHVGIVVKGKVPE
jgi:hypothetical protein